MSPAPVLAEDTRYRVELLVLTHLHHDQEPTERGHLADYSSATDFLTPVEEEEAEDEISEETSQTVAEEVAIGGTEGIDDASGTPETDETAGSEEEPDPNALVHIEEMSDVMREAWRRLRLSAPFRPEQYLSWEQGREAPFPALRVHDLEVVMVDDPFADLRRELLEEASEEQEIEVRETLFVDTSSHDEPEPVDEPEPAEEPGLPDPTIYYRLDGSARLIRTRFLHLELDLQLREAVWGEEDPAGAGTAAREEGLPLPDFETGAGEQGPPLPSAFLVHDLRQSRQVKTERMEYFDGPVLGVLAFITAVEPEEPDTP